MMTNLMKKLGVLLVLSLVVAVCCGAGAAADKIIFDGTVTLGIDDVSIPVADHDTPENVDGINGMAALDAAAKVKGFTYNASKDSWGLGISDINGTKMEQHADGTWYWWTFHLNDVESYEYLGNIKLKDGDKISLYYCSGDINTATSVLHIQIESPVIYSGNVDIVQVTYVPTANGGYSFATDLGVLALASSSLYGNFAYEKGVNDNTYNITKLGSKAANATHKWNVFLNENYVGYSESQPLMTVKTGDVVTAFFVRNDVTMFETAKNTASHFIKVTVASVSPQTPLKITLPKSASVPYALDAIQKAAEMEGLNLVTYESEYYGTKYTNLDSINGIGGDYGLFYSWITFKDGNEAGSLNVEQINEGDNVLTFYYCACMGYPNGESIDGVTAEKGYYYLDSSLYTIEVTLPTAKDNSPNAEPSEVKFLWEPINMGKSYNNGNELMPDGSPTVHGGYVYVTVWSAMGVSSAENSGVYCFDIATGKPKEGWDGTGFNSRAGITIDNNYLYVGYMDTSTGNGGVKCLNLADGSLVSDTGTIFTSSNAYLGITSTPLIVNDKVWVYSASNKDSTAALYRYNLDLTGGEEFVLSESPGGAYASIGISEDESTLYVSAGEGIWAISAESGAKLWEVDVDAADFSTGTPVYHEGYVYFMVAGESGGIYSVDGSSSEWTIVDGKKAAEKISTHKADVPTTPIIDSGYLYATGSEGLTAYNIEDKSVAWTHKGGNAYRASPTLAGSTIYYGTNTEGTLYAVTIKAVDESNRQVWKFKPYHSTSMYTIFEGTPCVKNGVLYIGAETVNAFYAISNAGTITPDDNSDTNTEGSISGGNTYVPPIQKPTVSYTPVNPGQGQMTYTTNHPNYAPATFTFDRMTAAGVLLSSGLNVVTAERWGGLYISAINGKSADNDPTGGWMCQVNGLSIPTMINNYPVSNGATVVFYYSESMSSSPDSSSYVYRFKVTTDGLQPLPTPTPTPTQVPESFTPAESSQITFQIPTGVTITSTETGKTVTIDTGLIKANEKSTVTVTEQAITITYPGVRLTIDLTEYTKKGDLATATLGGMKAYLVPAPVTILIGGYAL